MGVACIAMLFINDSKLKKEDKKVKTE